MRQRAARGQHLGLIGLILIGLIGTAQAQSPQLPLSDSATASVVTCGPGNEFYLAFGHSAIRISDPTRGIDHVYNYGTFDFDTPHFYLKFAQGQLNYCLSRTTFDRFLATYDYERRAVWEQKLDLDPQEVNNLYVMLEWNYLPENRYYRYDFFRDNCATRVRDMVESAAGHLNIMYTPCNGHSYRRMVHESAGPCQQWWSLGVDMLLGARCDLPRDVREAMFHPMAMMQTFADSRFGYSDRSREMARQTTQHLADHRPPLHRSFPPLVAFALLLVAVALLTWKRLWPRWADRILFIAAGIAGLFLCYMWFGTSHWCTKWNLNILWTSPLLLLIAIRLQRSPRWSLWLQEACFLAVAVYVIIFSLSPAIIPLILTLALRIAVNMTGKA